MKKKNRNTNEHIIKNKQFTIILVAAVILGAVIIMSKMGFGSRNEVALVADKDVVINKSEITETVKFYPAKVDNKKMEILAVKAGDGTIRTAFNTCQVCNGSTRAYYKQEGDVLVCQNCGNQFSMDMIELQRGGCNPVPIYKENKTDDGTNIVISKEFIAQNKELFTNNWKTK